MQREPEYEMAGPEADNSRSCEREDAKAAGNHEAQSEKREGMASREEAYDIAAAHADPARLPTLGVPLEEDRNREGSEANYRTADELGDATAAFDLAGLLAERGDLAAAAVAYRRADEYGHAGAASNLGVLLEQEGDLEGAEAAYRRADARGEAAGAVNLGALLAERGDLAGAAVALRHVEQRGDLVAARELRVLLERQRAHGVHEDPRTAARPLLRPKLLFGVGAVMIALAIAGLAEGPSHVQTNAPSSRATPRSVKHRPGWSSDQSGTDRRSSQSGG